MNIATIVIRPKKTDDSCFTLYAWKVLNGKSFVDYQVKEGLEEKFRSESFWHFVHVDV